MSLKKQSPVTEKKSSVSIDKRICSTHPESIAVIKSMVNRNIQSAIGYESSIIVECVSGTVTLQGYFAHAMDRKNALRVAISNPCIEKVINNAKTLTA